MSARLRDLFPNAAGSGAVWECAVTGVTPGENGLAVQLQSTVPVPSSQLEEARIAVCRAYGVAGVRLELDAPEEMPQTAAEAAEEAIPVPEGQPFDKADALREYFSKKYPSAAPCLREAAFLLSENRLTVQVAAPWHATRLEQLRNDLEKDAAALLEHPVRLELVAPAGDGADPEAARQARMAQMAR